MPRICVNIATSEVIPDFQDNAKEGSLILNAISAGLGSADDFEEQVVDKSTFERHVDDYKAGFADLTVAEELARTNARASIRQRLLDLGFTLQELKFMKEALENN